MDVCRPLHESAQPALFSGPTPSFPTLLVLRSGGDILSRQGTFGPRTTHPGGQLVLGPHVRGDSWSGGTRGPRTTCPRGQLVREESWSSYNVPDLYTSHGYYLKVAFISLRASKLCGYHSRAVSI